MVQKHHLNDARCLTHTSKLHYGNFWLIQFIRAHLPTDHKLNLNIYPHSCGCLNLSDESLPSCLALHQSSLTFLKKNLSLEFVIWSILKTSARLRCWYISEILTTSAWFLSLASHSGAHIPAHLFENSQKRRMLRALKFPVLSFISSTATAAIWVVSSEAVNSFLEPERQWQLAWAGSFENSWVCSESE